MCSLDVWPGSIACLDWKPEDGDTDVLELERAVVAAAWQENPGTVDVEVGP